jgi:hypothetical protein
VVTISPLRKLADGPAGSRDRHKGALTSSSRRLTAFQPTQETWAAAADSRATNRSPMPVRIARPDAGPTATQLEPAT